jgi:oxepin-CoA hydrolase/3-oxo-5,6-dehydrosuberyl-CoA semialdehyde dehydrogenase
LAEFHEFLLSIVANFTSAKTYYSLVFMKKVQNYVIGAWRDGAGEGIPQFNAYSGEIVGVGSSEGLDFGEVLDYARRIGGPTLRRMTFPERGRMLKRLALFLTERKESYYAVSHLTGATRADSWVDIEGGIGNLFAYSSLRRRFPDEPYYVESEAVRLSKENGFIGHHLLTPKQGVAVHINAFNFPIWGMLEKMAVNLLAGVPAVIKASEQTSFLTESMVRDIIASEILPEGGVQFIGGAGRGILDYVESQDVVTFTGSAATGLLLKNTPAVLQNNVPFNLEADSLNAAVLGPDAIPGTPEFELFIKEVRREMVTKAGQKCTAVRRILVPDYLLAAVQEALSRELSKMIVGDPSREGVRMGALINRGHLMRVREKLDWLKTECSVAYGREDFEVVGGTREQGAFMAPVLLLNAHPFSNVRCHDTECFGPVSTLMPYRDLEEAVALVRMGKGSLVSTVCTQDRAFQRDYVMEAAAYHGRILMLNRDSAPESTAGRDVPEGVRKWVASVACCTICNARLYRGTHPI